MKISYISDLHLDFHVPFTKNQIKFEKRTREFIQKLIKTDKKRREVLIIAGDLSHLNKQSYWAVNEFSKVYERVLVTFGNHDYYLISNNQSHKYKNHSGNRTKELVSMLQSLQNVHVFTNDAPIFKYKDVKFGGLTMWYPLDTDERIRFFSEMSNDSKLIKGFNIKEAYGDDIKLYNRLLEEGIDVLVTHVPVFRTMSHYINKNTHCYMSPVDVINAKKLVFGHVHEQEVYRMNGYDAYVNALGYPNELAWKEIRNFVYKGGTYK